MKGNFHVRFLEEGEGAISPSYSAIFTDTWTNAQFVFHYTSKFFTYLITFNFRSNYS